MAVTSQHFPYEYFGRANPPFHIVPTGPQIFKWRVAAIDVGEGVDGFPEHVVVGHHWLRLQGEQSVAFTNTFAVDCNLGEGFVNWGPTG